VRILIAVLLFALSGCLGFGSYDDSLNSYATKYATEVELSKTYLGMLRAHDLAGIEQHADASLRGKGLHANLETLARFFPQGDPTDVKLIGFWRNEILNAAEQATTRLDYEYDFSGKWYEATVVLKGVEPNISVAGLSVTALVGPLEEITKFKLGGKRAVDYAILFLTCAVPVFILLTLVVCVRTPMGRWKWLWIIFILFGVCGGSLNWLEGTFAFEPLAFRLFGAGYASGGPYSPVILQFSVPLGAILFLISRGRLMASRPIGSSSGGMAGGGLS